MRKLIRSLPALAGLLALPHAPAATLDDIRFWAGSGTNRAALVIDWSPPEVRNNTSVPNPAAEKSLVWGYRWNGPATAADLFNAILAADRRLFAGATAPSAYGTFIFSIGYDLNNNGVCGFRLGTNLVTGTAFTNGMRTLSWGDPVDSAVSLDAGDLFWSGLGGANWESWQEHAGAGGFNAAPDRGANPYWTATDTNYFSAGSHGQWDLASSLEFIPLKNGSWVGFTIAGGGLVYSDPDDPGSLAYNLHKQAPAPPEPALPLTPFAAQLVLARGPFDAAPCDDPASALGRPATRFYESPSLPATRVKMAEPAFNYAPDHTSKLIVTLKSGSAIIARFDHPVLDDPANPYGIDFQVFGNAFYAGSPLVDDSTDMNSFALGAAVFAEPMKVSVSPGFSGMPGESPDDPATWPWYRYESGPFCDTAFPAQAYRWDRAAASWTEELMDFTKPVNPALAPVFSAGGLTGADGADLYNGSGGGTGFDLKSSGFAAVQYIRVEGLPGYDMGELDAFSIVRRATLGDSLTIAPGNIAAGTARLFFQRPGAEHQNAVTLDFQSVGAIAGVSATRFDDASALAAVAGTPVNCVALDIQPVLGSSPVSLQASLALSADAGYSGDGSDLRVSRWNGAGWDARGFTFNPATRQAVVAGLTGPGAFVVSRAAPPRLSLQPSAGGCAVRFLPSQNCLHVLERSPDLLQWAPVASITPADSAPVTLQDSAPPAGTAFYRVRVAFP